MAFYKAMHSPSAHLFKNELYVAFYAGERECINQRVFIFKQNKKGGFDLFRQLNEGTGNPVLFEANGSLFCAYSVFTRPFIDSVFDLWKTTYTALINLTKDNFNADESTLLSTYCCPRSNPIYFKDGSVVLPCYDEEIERGVLFYIGKSKYISRSTCLSKHPVIQPSVFFKNGYRVLFRNFLSNRTDEDSYSPTCRMAFSLAQNKILYSDTSYSKIPNNNESLIGFNDHDGNALTVYNAKRGREDLTLGLINEGNDTLSSDDLLILNEERKASYPNHSFNKMGQLVVVYTSYDGSGVNEGSRIAITTVSKDYKRVLSTKYIDSSCLI